MSHLAYNIFELISVITAVIYYRSIKGSYMKWFLPFLSLIFFFEILAFYRWYISKQSTISINYLIGIIEAVFYSYIFYNISKGRNMKKIIFFFIPFSFFSYLFSYFFSHDKHSYFFYVTIFSGFFLAFFAIVYLYQLFLDDMKIIPLQIPGFWISLGVALFFSGVSIVFSLHEIVTTNDLTILGVRLYNFIPRVLSVILYSCISIAIILCKKKNRTSLLPL